MERKAGYSAIEQHGSAVEMPLKPDFLNRKYPLLVVDPYALNMIDRGPRSGKETRLSFYSSFILHAASEIIQDNVAQRVAVFSDSSFGPSFEDVGSLSRDYLIRPRENGSIISPNRVVYFEDPDLIHTAPQLKRVAKYLKEHGQEGQEILYVAWPNHMERIQNHSNGFGVNARVIDATRVHEYYEPKFDRQELLKALAVPLSQMESYEKKRRWVSKWDKKGRIPQLLKPVMGGAHMLDNKRTTKGKALDYRSGKARLRELGIKA